jgi:hypothetical protein
MTINVATVNDAPALGNNALTLVQGDRVVFSATQLSAGDIDDAAASLQFTVSGLTHGQFELTTAPGVPVLTFTQAQVSAGQVGFVHDGSGSAPTYEITVGDTAVNVGPDSANISFSLAPVISEPPILPPPPPPPPPPIGGTPSTPPPTPPSEPPATDPATESSTETDAPADEPAETVESGDTVAADGYALAPSSPAGARDGVVNALRPASLTQGVAGAVYSGLLEGKLVLAGLTEGPIIAPIDLNLVVQGLNTQYSRFSSNSLPDFGEASDFIDETLPYSNGEHFSVLLDSTQMSGIALSVGVVWWASRVTGVIGSLLASIPAWRRLDPLPVVGSDDDEHDEDWREYDLDAYADEIAVSMVLEGSGVRG